MGNSVGHQFPVLIANEGLNLQQCTSSRGRLTDAAAVAEVLQVIGGKKDAASRPYLLQSIYGFLQRAAPVPKDHRFLYKQPLQHSG